MSERSATRTIGYTAFALLGVSIVIHLVQGLSEVYAVLTDSGALAYAVLMLAGVAIPVALVGGMVAGSLRPSATYASLAVVMVLFLIAYVDVHALGYLESVTGVEFQTHDYSSHTHNGHSDSALDAIGEHLVDDPIALVAKVSEVIAAGLFAVLALGEQ